MNRKIVLRLVHGFFFICFAAAAGSTVWSWLTSDGLEGMIVGATIAAFLATISSFVERIFPMDE